MDSTLMDTPQAETSIIGKKDRDRLRWQCRRGLRELDELLQPFLRQHLYHINADELGNFRQLLTSTDPDLLDYLMKNKIPEDQGWVSIIEKIRSCAAD